MPQVLVDKIEKASTFNQGFATTEYLSSALVDMKLHLAGDRMIDADAFGAFVEGGGPYSREVAKRLRRHIFSVGNTFDPAEAYRRFRGREARTAKEQESHTVYR